MVDGVVVAAAAEERFSRRKHTSEFPKYAVQYCLEAAGVESVNDLDAVVFYEKPLLKFVRVVESLVGAWPRGLATFATRLPEFLGTKLNVYRTIARALPDYSGEILFSDHHLSHAAAAFYGSPFDRTAILSVDGVGESETTTVGIGDVQGIRLRASLHFPHSIGLLYSAVTGYLGFRVNDGEWKVMGLASYGAPALLDRFRALVDRRDDGSFRLNMRYFVHEHSSTWIADRGAWEALFGLPPRAPDAPLDAAHQDFARSAQALVEELLLGLAAHAKHVSGCDNLVIGGGVGLNSVANWRIEASGLFTNVWVHPAPGDDGAALGAALAVAHDVYGDPVSGALEHVYLGPAYEPAEVAAFLRSENVAFRELSDDALVEATADLLARGRIVGWCRGRMEFGPRALGNRSILGNAADPAMKARINTRVKFREYFRPFAPSVPLDDVHTYFDVPPGTALPFMVKVPPVRPEKRALIPAVTHQDGSGRVQTVTEEANPVYYRLLKAMQRRTGIPVIVNTSFNVRGEPMVCSPADAYRCFLGADLDALVVENCLIVRAVPVSVDADAGYALSDRLEGAIGSAPDSAEEGRERSDYFRYRPAIDSAAAIRKSNSLRRDAKTLHQRLSALGSGRVLVTRADAGQLANTIACHYPVQVTGVEPHPPALRHAKSVARLIVGHGSVVFKGVLPDGETAGGFDIVCGDGLQ